MPLRNAGDGLPGKGNQLPAGGVSFKVNIAQAGKPAPQKPLRLWPGVAAVVLQWLARFVVPMVVPGAMIFGVLGELVGGLAVIVWWIFFSRAPGLERWTALPLMIAAMFATSRILDKSIATGAQGGLYFILAVPVLSLALVAWAVASRRLSGGLRYVSMVATILVASGGWALVRTGGFDSDFHQDLSWRWAKTPEDRLVAREVEGHPVAAPAILAATAADWPGFRGPGRDSIIPGVRIKTDWSTSPPVQLWRRPVGPGWSSFAVHGDLIYTQEQRGADELVACYDAASGNPVWTHRDTARFWEANAGAGPRATPTLHEGRVYTFGATGIVNALDARDGAVAWRRDAVSDSAMKVPGWGFASSPLVVGDLVIVAAAGRLVAYDIATGAPRWLGPDRGDSYSSPQLLTIDGVPQVLLMSAPGVISVSPADGKPLWEYKWPTATRIMQPAMTADGGLLMTAGDAMGGAGMRRIGVSHGPDGWKAEEQWTSTGLKPSFNDSVIHDGYVYGFDGAILACLDVKDGKRKWKGGRYGAGQLVLLRDQGLLLVVSEDGELALVKAAPDQFTEVARFPALEGKTWNHPVLAGDRLLVRNASEMAAFRVSLERL